MRRVGSAPFFVTLKWRCGPVESPVLPKHGDSLTGQSVARLADYDSKLAGVYGDGRDAWAYVDLTGAWPADKGVAQRSLAALADWVVTQVGGALER